MVKSIQQANSALSKWKSSVGRGGWALAVLVAMCALPITARGSESLSNEGESSVLIATRDATEQDAEAERDADLSGSLEPIAAESDFRPELADEPIESSGAQSDNAAKFGAALADLTASQTNSQRLARRPAVELEELASTGDGSLPTAAKFNGIQPGTSTRVDVIDGWGEPNGAITVDEGEILVYETKPFRSVEVLISQDVVAAIKVELERAQNSKQLATQLPLKEIEPVMVSGPQGAPLGQAFPERGVLFMFVPTEMDSDTSISDVLPKVTHVVIQPLDANAFAMRAENNLLSCSANSVRDLKYALLLNPDLTHAHWLLAGVYIDLGKADMAEAESGRAFDKEPENAAYQLRHAKALKLLGNYDSAVQEVRAVLDQEDIAPLVQAQAVLEMGLLAGMGGGDIVEKAIPFLTKAIELADLQAMSDVLNERRAAKRLLVEAHLAVAVEIARQDYDNKLEAISQWIGRASGLAEDFIANDGGSMELRLMVAQQALAALASFKATKDPAMWVSEARETADELMSLSDDALWQRHIQWEVGIAYLHALQVEHMRRETVYALRYGQSAIEFLAEGAKSRQAVPSTERLVGRLYFQIGAVHAVHRKDHKQATLWYDKGRSLLISSHPDSELFTPGRDGEMLVSMGVSYWEQGREDVALELTHEGTDLIDQAVEAGALEKSALAVPYGNLASMYKQQGEADEAARFTKLSREAGATAKSSKVSANAKSVLRAFSPKTTASQPSRNNSSARSNSNRSSTTKSNSTSSQNQSRTPNRSPNRSSTSNNNNSKNQETPARVAGREIMEELNGFFEAFKRTLR